jgi:hypothetical protein
MARQDRTIWLDAERRFQVVIDANGAPTALTIDGLEHSLDPVRDGESWGPSRAGLAVVPSSTSLSTIIKLRNATAHPVLLLQDGRLTGVCDEREIIRALAGERPVS